jgi:hypothetical protein
MHSFTLPESAKVFPALKPATDAAGRTGRYFNVAFAHKLYFVFIIDQGNAATVTCDVLQATSAAGRGAKVLGGLVASGRISTLPRPTRSRARPTRSRSRPMRRVKEKLVIIEVNPADMDLANGFTYAAPRTGASNVANITAATAYIVPQYPGAAQPSYTA